MFTLVKNGSIVAISELSGQSNMPMLCTITTGMIAMPRIWLT